MGMNTKDSIAKNVVWKFAERLIARGISFIVSIILARLLMPSEYGLVAMSTIFITIGNTLLDCSFGTALIQKLKADDLDFSSVFFFNIVFSVALYLILFFCTPLIAEFYNNMKIISVLRVLGLSIIVVPFKSMQQVYVSRHMMFRKFFWSTLFGTLLSAVVGILMAYAGFGVWALIAQSMTNTIVDTCVLWFTVKWRPIFSFSFNRLKSLISYGWKILVEGLANTFVLQLRGLVIGKVYAPSSLAYYTKGESLPQLLVDNISSSLNSVLFPAMSLNQDNREHMVSLLRKSIALTSYILFPLLTGMAVVAKPLISVVLTDKWLACAPFIRIFCFTQAATIGMIPRHQALKAIGRSDVFMYEHIFSRGVGLILLFCVYKISVLAVAMSLVASSVILTLVVMFTSKKYNGYSYKHQIADVLPILMGCLIMGLPTYLLQYLPFGNFVILVLQVVCGGILYLGYSVLLRLEGFKLAMVYVQNLLNKRKGGKRKNG